MIRMPYLQRFHSKCVPRVNQEIVDKKGIELINALLIIKYTCYGKPINIVGDTGKKLIISPVVLKSVPGCQKQWH